MPPSSWRWEKAIRGGRQTYEWRVGKLKDIQNEVKRLATEVSVMSHALRPSVLDELGLVAAVRTSLTNLEETAGIKAKIQVLGSERRLDPDLELGLFRIIQEALSNARKHSEAHSVEIRIEFCSQLVSVAISDDGKGFEAPRRLSDLAATGKLGLTGMDERANTFGGRLFLESKPNEGTVIRVEIPYQKSTLNSRAT